MPFSKTISLMMVLSLMFSTILVVSCSPKKKQEKTETIETKTTKYQFEKTKKVVALVDDAAKLIEEEGKAIFPEFRKKGSKWYQGDTYVFVWGLDGMRYVYPRNPEKEGKNMLDLKDVNGKPIGKMFVNAAKQKEGKGWVFYEWTKPGQDKPVWKASFIKKAVAPSGIKYLVGCGKYNIKMEKEFVVQTVSEATNLLKKDGKKAFKIFNSPTSKFIYMDSYVFVKDIQGNELFNPNSPEIVGKNLIDIQDVNGKYFVREEIEILRDNNSCWMDYYWQKPGEKEPSKKIVYVEKVIVDGDTLVVGSGYYPEK